MRKVRKRPRGNRKRREPLLSRVRRRAARAAKTVLVAVLVPAAGYASWLLYGAVTTTHHLAVERVVVTGTERVSESEVLALASAEIAGAIGPDGEEAAGAGLVGANMFSFSTARVEEGIEENPWIDRAELRRRPPHTVKIDVTERRPLALVRMDRLYVMDERGVVFKEFHPGDGLDLPVITGLDARDEAPGLPEDKLLALVGILRGREGFNLDRVSEIHVDAVYGLTVYTLDDGVRLELGTSRFEDKLVSFEKILMARNGSLAGIEAMDLTNSREVIVRFTTNVSREGGVI